MVYKIFIYSEFPDTPEESWRRRRWRKPANAKSFDFQANVKKEQKKPPKNVNLCLKN